MQRRLLISRIPSPQDNLSTNHVSHVISAQSSYQRGLKMVAAYVEMVYSLGIWFEPIGFWVVCDPWSVHSGICPPGDVGRGSETFLKHQMCWLRNKTKILK